MIPTLGDFYIVFTSALGHALLGYLVWIGFKQTRKESQLGQRVIEVAEGQVAEDESRPRALRPIG